MKMLILMQILFNITLVAQQKKNITPKVVYRDNKKAPVDCEVFKNGRDGTSISLGRMSKGFVMEKQCNQGDIYTFHPKSTNYRNTLKECNIKDDTIFLIPQRDWAILSRDSYSILNSESPTVNYAIAAISSQILLAISDERKDSLLLSREKALVKYFNGDISKTSDRTVITNALYRQLVGEARNFQKVDVAKTLIADPYSISNFYFKAKGDRTDAWRWADVAIVDNPAAYWAKFLKAEIIGAQGDKSLSIRVASQSLQQAKDARDTTYVKVIEAFLNRSRN